MNLKMTTLLVTIYGEIVNPWDRLNSFRQATLSHYICLADWKHVSIYMGQIPNQIIKDSSKR